MEDYFWEYNIFKKDKLSYAVDTLTGEAYTWWLKEEECRIYYKESVRTWQDLKWLMYEQYVTRSLTSRNCHKKVLKPFVKQAPISTSLPKSQAPNQTKVSILSLKHHLTLLVTGSKDKDMLPSSVLRERLQQKQNRCNTTMIRKSM
ncbi:unnamed protein product [Arabis nemorensis]|uniref:Retrotransposon gag domain-containing protein n=1 Tax=Arabis nemorensis TaxID=586526 RepID=A0A565BVX3_9BRAS|nr:unnamed protein product [Arabis nemorensis]